LHKTTNNIFQSINKTKLHNLFGFIVTLFQSKELLYNRWRKRKHASTWKWMNIYVVHHIANQHFMVRSPTHNCQCKLAHLPLVYLRFWFYRPWTDKKWQSLIPIGSKVGRGTSPEATSKTGIKRNTLIFQAQLVKLCLPLKLHHHEPYKIYATATVTAWRARHTILQSQDLAQSRPKWDARFYFPVSDHYKRLQFTTESLPNYKKFLWATITQNSRGNLKYCNQALKYYKIPKYSKGFF